MSFEERIKDEVVRQLSNGGQPSLRFLLPRLRGTPPDLVRNALSELSYAASPGGWDSTVSALGGSLLLLEPHPLDFDWRFTTETVTRLVEILSSSASVLLMGAPSVWEALLSRNENALLCDRNPLLGLSHPDKFRLVDFRLPNVPERLPQGSIVFIDPPWYPRDLLSWLRFAVLSLPSGGVVYFSLWPELTRPTADSERQQIIESLSRHGDIELISDGLWYEVPPFEYVAFAQRGIHLDFIWRSGDLVRFVPVDRKGLLRSLEVPLFKPETVWFRFEFDGRQLAIRLSKAAADEPQLYPLPSFSKWYADTVSRRDPRRAEIDLWGSTNFVAGVQDSAAVVSVLLRFAESPDSLPSDSTRRIFELLIEHKLLPEKIPTTARIWTHLD